MKIGRLIKRWRMFEEQRIRETAKEIGISAATLSRIENGENVDGKTIMRLLTWLMK
ncbi:MAG TPA: XRE family transcriptional regulator [Nitrospirae bacterium]|nr:XRE family transcriptional regulator [Nitrospirota bacterium]